jgi:hypothetical protein
MSVNHMGPSYLAKWLSVGVSGGVGGGMLLGIFV